MPGLSPAFRSIDHFCQCGTAIHARLCWDYCRHGIPVVSANNNPSIRVGFALDASLTFRVSQETLFSLLGPMLLLTYQQEHSAITMSV